MLRSACLAALALLAMPAAAQDMAEILARAPALGLEGPVRPLDAPIRVGGEGWGPFSRLCVSRGGAGPTCLEITATRQEGGTWRLDVRVPDGRGGSISYATTRDAAGAIGPLDFGDRVAGLPAAQRAMLEEVFRAALEAQGLPTRMLPPGARFTRPLPGGLAGMRLEIQGGGLQCEAEGLGALRGRPVLVAVCTADGSGTAGGAVIERLAMAGRFAHDIETGLVLESAYASSARVRAGNGPVMPAQDMTRQSLQ